MNNDDASKDTRYWYQKMWNHINPQGSTRSYAMCIVCLISFIFIAIVINWNYFRPRWYKKIYKNLLQFKGFKYSHLDGVGTS